MKYLIFLCFCSLLSFGQTPTNYIPHGGRHYYSDSVRFNKTISAPNTPVSTAGLALLQINTNGLFVRDTSCGKPWCTGGNTPTNSTSFLGTTNSKDLVFKTKNTEAMRIDTNGNVGIGTATPAYKLEVLGNAMIRNANGNVLSFVNTNEGFTEFQMDKFSVIDTFLLRTGLSIEFATNRTVIALDDSMDVGIGTATPTAKLHVNGTTRLEGTPQSTTSDSLLTIDNAGNVAWRTPYYYGTDTLTNGVDTVWTSNVTANSNIQLTSNGLNGSTQSGHLDVTIISAGNYFVVNSLKANTTVETGDQRKYYWFFIRKP